MAMKPVEGFFHSPLERVLFNLIGVSWGQQDRALEVTRAEPAAQELTAAVKIVGLLDAVHHDLSAT